jgi:hypothetical protein
VQNRSGLAFGSDGFKDTLKNSTMGRRMIGTSWRECQTEAQT